MLLTISNNQIEALDALELQKFVDRTIIHLNEKYADWVLNKEKLQLQGFIYSIINFAKQFNIDEEKSLLQLMEIEIQNTNLLNHKMSNELRRILKNKKRKEDMKIEFLKHEVTFTKGKEI